MGATCSRAGAAADVEGKPAPLSASPRRVQAPELAANLTQDGSFSTLSAENSSSNKSGTVVDAQGVPLKLNIAPSEVVTNPHVAMFVASGSMKSATNPHMRFSVKQRTQRPAEEDEKAQDAASVTDVMMSLMAVENVAYVTDIEGNFEYLTKYIELSAGLTLQAVDATDGSLVVELHEGWRFIFGGDSVDKGGAVGGSIRVVRTLLRLKRAYPERVSLILGNRDLNKMRFTSELADAEMANWATVPGAPWVTESKRVSPRLHLARLVAKERAIDEAAVDEAMLAEANTLSERIRWMLKETMGSDGEYERRRAELSLLAGGAGVPDDAVAASFLDSARPGGFMHELIREGQLAEFVSGTLYVHGGLLGRFGEGTTDCFGDVPGRSERIVSDARAWVDELNAWKDRMVDEWRERPEWQQPSPTTVAEYDTNERGGAALMRYGTVGQEPSVVLGRHLLPDSMPAPLPDALVATLNAAGVRRLVLGHTPHGDCPTIIRNRGKPVGAAEGEAPYVEVIMADTSYSDMCESPPRCRASSSSFLSPSATVPHPPATRAVPPSRAQEEPRQPWGRTLRGVRAWRWWRARAWQAARQPTHRLLPFQGWPALLHRAGGAIRAGGRARGDVQRPPRALHSQGAACVRRCAMCALQWLCRQISYGPGGAGKGDLYASGS